MDKNWLESKLGRNAEIEKGIELLLKEKKEIREEVIEYYINEVRAKYPEIKEGDLVKVTSKDILEKDSDNIIETGYFDGCEVSSYIGLDSLPNLVKWRFREVKKDKTPSTRAFLICNDEIINIEKIVIE